MDAVGMAQDEGLRSSDWLRKQGGALWPRLGQTEEDPRLTGGVGARQASPRADTPF